MRLVVRDEIVREEHTQVSEDVPRETFGHLGDAAERDVASDENRHIVSGHFELVASTPAQIGGCALFRDGAEHACDHEYLWIRIPDRPPRMQVRHDQAMSEKFGFGSHPEHLTPDPNKKALRSMLGRRNTKQGNAHGSLRCECL